MKKVVFVAGFLISTLNTFSQSEIASSEKRMKIGFNAGINQSNFINKEKLPPNASLSNHLGFRLGILADYKITNFLSVSPKAELSFNSSKLKFANTDGSHTKYEIMPISLDFMAHFIFKKNYKNLSPYFYFGPDVKNPISKKNNTSRTFTTYSDFAIDFGIGIEKGFTHFNFCPELRCSFGLLNVNQDPLIQKLYFHNISLIFNFLG